MEYMFPIQKRYQEEVSMPHIRKMLENVVYSEVRPEISIPATPFSRPRHLIAASCTAAALVCC